MKWSPRYRLGGRFLCTDCASCNTAIGMIQEETDTLGVVIKLEKMEDIQATVAYGVVVDDGVCMPESFPAGGVSGYG